ncbi:MAG: dihydrolipoyl dehydrogenase [Blautia sp.]|nr:dihydrolipoyl dehydrogenase [Blautia sp.]
MRDYDLVVIGGGPGGYEAILYAAEKYGMRTALIEKEALGGTCLNHGCIPTKTLLHSADLYRQFMDCERFGLSAGQVSYDMEKIQARKSEVVNNLRSGIELLMKQKKVDVIKGTGCIIGPNEVEAKDFEGNVKKLETEHILIATGSCTSMPPIPGADLPGVYTSDTLLERKEEPFDHLLIIGGGVIGMEFASIYNSLGSKVTVLEAMPRIISNMDKELSQSLKMLMKKRGVAIITGAMVEKICSSESGEGILECTYKEKETVQSAKADGILVCTGRRPYTTGLFGEGFTLSMERGCIVTAENGETSVPGIYAIGDVTGGIMLAHAATAMGRNAVAHMNGAQPPVNLSVIPACIYTDPEIASVGLTADQAKELGIAAGSRKALMTANGKTVLSGQERGFIKVVFEKETKKLLGAQMMCARASDMISEFAQAITTGLTLDQMYSVIRPHPTFSEAITEACN